MSGRGSGGVGGATNSADELSMAATGTADVSQVVVDVVAVERQHGAGENARV